MDANPFEEALAHERKLREEAYVDVPHFICGIPLKQITPLILAVLFRVETPYLGAGNITNVETARFLWACHVDNPMRAEKKRWFVSTSKQRFIKSIKKLDFDEAEYQIWKFLDETFLDAPDGGGKSRPYVCSVASIEYAMNREPFRWPWQYTRNQPLRRIYQLMRCRAREHGVTISNRVSDGLLGSALDDANTPENMAKRAEEFRTKFNQPKGEN